MPIIRSRELEEIETPGGNTGAGLATPSRGATEVSVIRQRQLPSGANPIHTHDREEVMVMVAGAVTLTLSGEGHSLGAGDVAIIPSGVAHQIANRGGETAEWLLIAPAPMRYFHANGDEAMPPWSR